MKYISYNEKTKVFTLRTKNSMYQMQVRAYDTLVHLYYGADIGDTEAVHRIICLDRGFSGNPYEAGEDRTRWMYCRRSIPDMVMGIIGLMGWRCPMRMEAMQSICVMNPIA